MDIILNLKTKIMKCRACNREVGCGCNLKNGLCSACREIPATPPPPPPKPDGK